MENSLILPIVLIAIAWGFLASASMIANIISAKGVIDAASSIAAGHKAYRTAKRYARG